MKKSLILFLIFGLAFSACLPAGKASAQIKLKDVADDHWAASAVYDLVKLGVTKGYPDGTFRGNKPITRYETAIFLSKLAKAIGGEDIKADIKALKDQIVELKKAPRENLAINGSYAGNWRFGNVLAAQGSARAGVANYRLTFSATKEFSEGADIKVNLDTMDYGFYDDGSAATPGRGLLASELLDLQSDVKLDLSEFPLGCPIDLKLTYGPGPKRHAADPTGSFPSDVNTVYLRPDTGVLASTRLFGAEVKGGYYSVQSSTLETSGKINTGWMTGAIGFTLERFLWLNSLKIELAGDYISRGLFSSSDRSIKAKVDLLAPLGEKVQASGTVGFGRTFSKTMVAGSLAVNDIWDTGTVVIIRAAKIGSEFIDARFAWEQNRLAGYDNFMRPLEAGTVNLGGELTQFVSDRAKLVGKGDLRLSGDYKYSGAKARLTAEGGLSYNIAPSVNLDASYRVYQDKGTGDTSDIAAIGLIYRF